MPLNFLVSSHDLVPGVQRQAAAAAADSGMVPPLGMLGMSQLAPLQLQPLRAVVLSDLRAHLPEAFAEAARQRAAGLWRQSHGALPAALPSPGPPGGCGSVFGASMPGSPGKMLPLRELQQSLQLRVSVHNGLRVVGPPVLCAVAALAPAEGGQGGWLQLAAGCLTGPQHPSPQIMAHASNCHCCCRCRHTCRQA